jgi:two-component system osmolarity sensor histidine kinase EnvZ
MASTEMERPSGGGLGTRSWRALTAVPRSWNRFWRRVSLYMPKRLYARSLLIVITPMILLQSVVAFVFMERHWQTVTVSAVASGDTRHRRHHRPARHLSAA